MRFKDYSVTQIMVGLHRIGVVGLHEALRKAEEQGLEERDAVVDRVMEHLQGRNYIPHGLVEEYRTAVWREYLRNRGEDFREFYSEAPVTVRGEPGEERDRFVELVRSVFAQFELNPVITFEQRADHSPSPHLVIGGEVVATGDQSRRSLEAAVRQSMSDW